MRAGERHELKENELAKILASSRIFLKEKGKALGLAVVAVVVVIAAIGYASSSRAAHIEDAWRKKAELTFATPAEGRESLKKLSDLIADTSDSAFVQAALLEQGTQALRLSQQSEIPPDPELNDLARSAFEQLLDRARSNLFAQAAAHSGLATVAENDFAIDHQPKHKDITERHLKEIVNDARLQTTPFYTLATDRLADLGETFEVVRFAAAPPPPPPALQPEAVQPAAPQVDAEKPQPVEEPVETSKFMRVRMSEDGTIEVVPDDEQ